MQGRGQHLTRSRASLRRRIPVATTPSHTTHPPHKLHAHSIDWLTLPPLANSGTTKSVPEDHSDWLKHVRETISDAPPPSPPLTPDQSLPSPRWPGWVFPPAGRRTGRAEGRGGWSRCGSAVAKSPSPPSLYRSAAGRCSLGERQKGLR